MDNDVDPYRQLHRTAVIGASLFGVGYWATLIVAIAGGDFTLGGLLVALLVTIAVGLGFLGRRRREVTYTGASLALLLGSIALSGYVTG